MRKDYWLKNNVNNNYFTLTQPCSSIDVGVGLLNDVTTTGSPKAVLAKKLSDGMLSLT